MCSRRSPISCLQLHKPTSKTRHQQNHSTIKRALVCTMCSRGSPLSCLQLRKPTSEPRHQQNHSTIKRALVCTMCSRGSPLSCLQLRKPTSEPRPQRHHSTIKLALVCTMCSRGSPLRFSAASATTEAGENSMNSASSLQKANTRQVGSGSWPALDGTSCHLHHVPCRQAAASFKLGSSAPGAGRYFHCKCKSHRTTHAHIMCPHPSPVHQGAVHQALLHRCVNAHPPPLGMGRKKRKQTHRCTRGQSTRPFSMIGIRSLLMC